MDKGSENLIDQAINIAYYMRGSIQYEEIFNRTFLERKKIVDFINRHMEKEMEKVKKSKGKLHAIY